MVKTVEILPTLQTCRDVKGIPPEGPWKVKEWKWTSPQDWDPPTSNVLIRRHASAPLSSTSSRPIRRPRPLAQRLDVSRRRPRKYGIRWISAGIGGAIAMLAVSSYWPKQLTLPNALTLAEARTFSSLETQAPDGTYRLQLGSYQDEIGARYAWIAYQASVGGPLDNWEPHFEQFENEGALSYRILAGTFVDPHEADHLCTHMQIRDVPCTLVELQ